MDFTLIIFLDPSYPHLTFASFFTPAIIQYSSAQILFKRNLQLTKILITLSKAKIAIFIIFQPGFSLD